MKVVVTGASGFIGSNLKRSLEAAGHDVFSVTRKKSTNLKQILWSVESNQIELDKLENVDVLIHLAAEPVTAPRWTETKKERIKNSRIQGTRLIVDSLEKLKNGPKLFISASAIGVYGSKADKKLDEGSAYGKGFLAELGKDWEAEANRANELGTRVVNARIGLVLDKTGGILKSLKIPFSLGLGGIIGNGKQYMSWIALEDIIQAFRFIIDNKEISGAVNLVAPNPVTNSTFTLQLAKALKRPAIFPLPAFVARIIFGEMADEMLLSSTRVYPKKLIDYGFEFQHTDLKQALENTL